VLASVSSARRQPTFPWIGSTTAFGSVVMIENSVWSPMLGTFLLPPSPAHGRQTPAKKKGCLSARSNQCPHHGALRCVLVGLGEGCRRNDATMLAVQSVAPQVVLQAPEVGPVTGAWLATASAVRQ
jgi:hypothetical protein